MWLVRFKQLFIISTSCFCCYVKEVEAKTFSGLFLLINASRKMVSDSHSVFPKYMSKNNPKTTKLYPSHTTHQVFQMFPLKEFTMKIQRLHIAQMGSWFDLILSRNHKEGFGEGNAPKPSLWLLQKKITFAFRLKVMPCYPNTFQMVQKTNICSLYHTLSFAEHLLTSDVFHERCGLLGLKQ